VRRKRPENGNETAGFFCTTTHLHIVRCQKLRCRAQYDGFGACTVFLGLVTARLIIISATENVLKGQRFVSAEEVTAKVTRVLTEVSSNGYHECLQKL
jgi:hypothetical protein